MLNPKEKEVLQKVFAEMQQVPIFSGTFDAKHGSWEFMHGDNKEKDTYVIVDGFHRYRVMLDYPDIREREGGMLPVSVIDKSIDNRMASTIRHNRARGSHDVDLMSNIVMELHELGRSDAWISKHLGMDKDEILRLKQITGLAALFREVSFGEAWVPVDDEFDYDTDTDATNDIKTLTDTVE